MSTFYAIGINDGIFTIRYIGASDYTKPADYFADFLGGTCPEPIKVIGWPFAEIYIANGDAENGVAVAWS